MPEIVSGKITDISPDGLTIFVPYSNWERAARREYEEVEVALNDGRTISPEQRRTIYSFMGDISAWSGYERDQTKLVMKQEFINHHLEGLNKQLFSLSDCDMTTAREFQRYLLDFMFEFDVPASLPLHKFFQDDIEYYVYACVTHKRCCICGKKADLHHLGATDDHTSSHVGMGRDRTEICHIGMMCLPLCREHHMEAHQHGDQALMDKFHLTDISIDEKIAKIYKLGKKETK